MLAPLYFSVTMVLSVCPHGWKPSSDLVMIPTTGATWPTSPAVLWFPSIWGTFFLPLSVATCFRNTLQARLSIRSRGGSGWAPHSPSSCSLSLQPFTSTLSCSHLIWKLTTMTAARARSPTEGWGRDNRRAGTSSAEKKVTTTPGYMSSWHTFTRVSVLQQSESPDPNQYPLKLAGDDKTRGRLCPRTLGPRGGRKHPGACSQEGRLDGDAIKRDAPQGGCDRETTLRGRRGVIFLSYSVTISSGLSAHGLH